MRTLILSAALGLAMAATAQNYNDLTELVRSDVRTEKQAVVLANLGLNAAQSAAFTPVYDAYSVEIKANWDKRIALIKDYASKYQTMNDETAGSLMKRSNALDKDAISIREKYAKKLTKVLPTTIAARWMQIESRLDKAISLQIADEIPLMPAHK